MCLTVTCLATERRNASPQPPSIGTRSLTHTIIVICDDSGVSVLTILIFRKEPHLATMNFSEGNGKLLLTSVVGVLGLGSLAYFLASDSAVSE